MFEFFYKKNNIYSKILFNINYYYIILLLFLRIIYIIFQQNFFNICIYLTNNIFIYFHVVFFILL
jgi:hypothetical protein